MKRAPAATVAVVAGLGVIHAFGQDAAPPKEELPEVIAKRIFAPGPPTGSWQERDQALLALNRHCVAVRREILDLLARQPRGGDPNIAFGSPVHCALQSVGFWGAREAQGHLFELIGYRLDPTTVPDGVRLPGSAFYPAAHALASLPLRPEMLFQRMTDGNLPLLTWVLAETQGMEGAEVLLKHRIEAGRYDAAILKRALELLRSKEHACDLLPQMAWVGK